MKLIKINAKKQKFDSIRVLLTCGLLSALMSLEPSLSFSADTKPKYGAEAIVLSKSHEYFRNHAAPDFWAISPYYTAQQDEKSCSLASTTMIVNAARAGRALKADDELATQAGILKRTKDEDWQKAVGPAGHGVALDDFGKLIEESLKNYGVEKFKIETVHVADLSKATREKLHKALVENEKSADDFIIINFLQGVYTGDADVGHLAPIAAYDSASKKVLVMDPDRQWYEPYWVSEETLLKGMATKDSGVDKNRGYVWIHLTK